LNKVLIGVMPDQVNFCLRICVFALAPKTKKGVYPLQPIAFSLITYTKGV